MHEAERVCGAAAHFSLDDQHEVPGGHPPDGRVAGDFFWHLRLVLEVLRLAWVDLPDLSKIILGIMPSADGPSGRDHHSSLLQLHQGILDFCVSPTVVDHAGNLNRVSIEGEVFVHLQVDHCGPIVFAAPTALGLIGPLD